MRRHRALLGQDPLCAVRRAALCAALLACMGAAWPVPARVRLSLHAPATCAHAEDFEKLLSTEAEPPATLAVHTERELRVRIEENADGVSGEIWLGESEQEVTPRRVMGRSCEEVVDALLFVTSLALSAQRHEPDASATQVSTAPVGAAEAPALARLDQDHRWEAANRPLGFAVAGSVGPTLQAATDVSPIIGAVLALQLEFPHRVRPALRLEASFGKTPRGTFDFGWVELALSVARVEISPGRITWNRIRLGCGFGFEAGVLNARGVDRYQVPLLQRRSTWLALSESVRAELRLRGGWYSELTLSLIQPLSPDYFLEPEDLSAAYRANREPYELPTLGFASALAVGYRYRGPDAAE